MKRLVLSFFTVCVLLRAVSALHAVSYEASTLHNAVSRSETVQDLFFSRWESIEQKELYFDLYGKINWVPDFKINTVNAGSETKETVPMTLVRTYGSMTVNFPIIGGYEGTGIKDRLSGRAKKEGEEEAQGSGPFGLWKPKNLVVGFTASGFHYGLTRKTEIDRGPGVGTETVTDYKYSQFFDDIFALSLLYRPYFQIHGGVVINNQIEPNDDGTMDYGNSSHRDVRYFMASNLLSFLNVNATTSSSELESMAVAVDVMKLTEMLTGPLPLAVPRLTVTYKLLKLYNDEPYDAVWVKTSVGKSSVMDDDLKERAQLHTLSFLVKENLFYYVYIDLYAEFQKADETLVDKRSETDRKLTLDPVREAYASVAYNFLGKKAQDGFLFTVSGGLSRYWDPAIPVHRKEGTNYYLYGGFGALNITTPLGGAEVKGIYNYAPELRKLVETADKFAIEGSVFFHI